jgi:hypothetical protein
MFCPHCGKEITEGQTFCQHCGSRLSADSGIIAPAGGRSKTPWEDRENTGYFGGLFRTAREVLFSPTRFFQRMPVTGGVADPLLYSLIMGMIGLMFFYLWDIMLHDSMQSFMTPEMKAAAGRTAIRGVSSVFTAVITPFLLILWMFVVSGMLHLFLMLARGAKAGFEATFRVVGYSISPFLFLAIPFCGLPITAIWAMMSVIIGLREAHETAGGKAAFAVLFPFIFCCGAIIILAVIFMSAFVASFGSLVNMRN